MREASFDPMVTIASESGSNAMPSGAGTAADRAAQARNSFDTSSVRVAALRGLDELRHDVLRGAVRVAHAQVDHVLPARRAVIFNSLVMLKT